MSKPGIIYRVNWQGFSLPDPVTGEMLNDLQLFIDISDNDNLIDDGDEATIIDLKGAGEPARVSVIDNNESPFTVILAQQLTIRFASTTQVNMNTFIRGSDQRFSVHYYLSTDDQTIFKGFLIADENSITEDFLYPPNIVTLTANDGLPLLKDIPLVNADSENPAGYHKISDYLSWALRKTGLDLSMFAAFNIKSVDDISDISVPNTDPEHFFYVEYLEAKTFENEIGNCISSYEAIEIILKYEARIFQFQGKWWIVRIDEIEDETRGLFITEYDSSGSFVGNLGEFDLRKYIGTGLDIRFSEAATQVTATRATKSLRLNYNFDLPLEIPCNVDFSRGTNEVIISATEKNYDIECWTLLENRPLVTSTHATAIIVKKFINGYEDERYSQINLASSSIEQMLTSEWIYVNKYDLFDLSVQVKHDGQIDTGSGAVRGSYMQVHLFADDGTFYNLNGGRSDTGTVPVWRSCTSSFNTNQSYFGVTYDAGDDDTEWRTVGFESGPCPPVPKKGKIRILLCATYKVTTFKTIFSPVSFDLKPFINGSNAKYSGQYHTCFQNDPATGVYKKKIEEQVFMSDSPHPMFKGALFEFDGSVYNLSGLFYNAAVFPGGPPSTDYHHRYGEIQLFDVWNQFKTEMIVIQGNQQGVDLDKTFTISGDTLPYPAHLLSKWKVQDVTDYTSNKYFLLLHFDQDHNTGAWTGVFREVVDYTRAKDYSNHEFKFIS